MNRGEEQQNYPAVEAVEAVEAVKAVEAVEAPVSVRYQHAGNQRRIDLPIQQVHDENA